ncbi:pyrroloquinoline quinone biosynthesis protein PqqC [Salinisphaera sp. Q1T1-3]|nr:pyrroloquinoline-quinone synthase PqqC [Salinisphaera sp. Q1T1-3]RJS91665.1 pyrroloquinoline quinone biosynthesis protein PqqC [Salinisphaera sp. Q1T1-3]
MRDTTSQAPAWPRDVFEAKLRALGARYHIHHPYHRLMHEGRASRAQIQGWVANRYHYQVCIPIKDANVLANCPDPATRRLWVQRILDHDGTGDDPGGIEAWLALAAACGMDRDRVAAETDVLPGVRFAVDAYVNFARRASWQEAACSSLTELFAPEIHQQRLTGWPDHYPWIADDGLGYFRKRLSEARRDVEHGLNVTLDHFTTRTDQERALDILQFKLDVLWSMLDAMWMAYVEDRPPYQGCPPVPEIDHDD